jgi:Family of unknown function (DUF6130)
MGGSYDHSHKAGAGPHFVLVESPDPTYKVIASETIEFTVPEEVNNSTSTANQL